MRERSVVGAIPDPEVAGEPSTPRRYARSLFATLGRVEFDVDATDDDDAPPAIEWARSGAMSLTGFADGPPKLAPGPLASCSVGAMAALRKLSGRDGATGLDAAALLGERAALAGLTRRGPVSPSGTCRLLRARDHWLALQLARPDDVDLLPAWLESETAADAWCAAARLVSGRAAEPLVARGREMGLPVALAEPPRESAPDWLRVAARGRAAPAPAPGRAPFVVDLSALWAGPLCASLLADAGARVVKVESTGRPDGARFGPSRFYDLLNAGKESVALDFSSLEGRRALAVLLARADVVVASARPRALAGLGIDLARWIAERPGRTAVSITGYGLREPGSQWVAFGDDAAVAAGLAVATGSASQPIFCGDAIADPLTGIHAALAAFASWSAGGGQLLDLSLRDVTAHVLAFEAGSRCAEVRSARGSADRTDWIVSSRGFVARVAAPRARSRRGVARPLGADTNAVLAEVAPC